MLCQILRKEILLIFIAYLSFYVEERLKGRNISDSLSEAKYI
jgi:hypothetical protein